jgi:hypothetical protein
MALHCLDPSSVAFYMMMYVGLDMDTNPHFAHAAVRNEHVPARVRQQPHAHSDFVSYDRLPRHFTNASHYRPHVPLVGDEQVCLVYALAEFYTHSFYES